jgi:hypothetical protein
LFTIALSVAAVTETPDALYVITPSTADTADEATIGVPRRTPPFTPKLPG